MAMGMTGRTVSAVIGLVTIGALAGCGGGPASTPSITTSTAAPTTTTGAPPTTVTMTTTAVPSTTAAPTTTTKSAGSVPPGGVSAQALDFLVQYIDTGYCTPNDTSQGCQVATTSDQSVAGPLAPGAYRVVGYHLCPWSAASQDGACIPSVDEGTLVAQAFPSSALAHSYLELQAQQGTGGTGWQFNQWAILISPLPQPDEGKLQEALSSAAQILNGQTDYQQTAPNPIGQAF